MWQVSHAAVVETCVPDLPVAIVPLWQVAQLPVATVTEVCNLAPTKLVVDLWQLSQAGHEVVGKWVLVLPSAVVPLWQFAHFPASLDVWA